MDLQNEQPWGLMKMFNTMTVGFTLFYNARLQAANIFRDTNYCNSTTNKKSYTYLV